MTTSNMTTTNATSVAVNNLIAMMDIFLRSFNEAARSMNLLLPHFDESDFFNIDLHESFSDFVLGTHNRNGLMEVHDRGDKKMVTLDAGKFKHVLLELCRISEKEIDIKCRFDFVRRTAMCLCLNIPGNDVDVEMHFAYRDERGTFYPRAHLAQNGHPMQVEEHYIDFLVEFLQTERERRFQEICQKSNTSNQSTMKPVGMSRALAMGLKALRASRNVA